MRVSKTIVASCLLAVALAGAVLAHGVRTEVAVGSMTVVTFTHEDGSPMVRTPFTVLAPRHTQPFLSGTTDVHGRVVFLPDEAGEWKVRVAGADGHGAVVTIAVDSTALEMTSQEPAAVYTHDHDQLEVGAPSPAPAEAAAAAGEADHDHGHGGGHGQAHEPPRPATRGGVADGRWFNATAGLAVLIVVLMVAVLVARRRRG